MIEFPRKNQLFDELLEFTRPLKDLKSIQAGMSWDQETFMPPAAYIDRGGQMSTVAAIYHEIITGSRAKEFYDEIKSASKPGLDIEKALYREFTREYEKENVIPLELIQQISRKRSICLQSWKDARIKNDFSIFANDLQDLVNMKVRYAACFSDFGNHYNVLLDSFEPGMNTAILDDLFDVIKGKTVRLLTRINLSGREIDNSFLFKFFNPDQQLDLARKITRRLGFDYSRGRLDSSVHPFTMPISGNDVRMTTRLNNYDIRTCFYGTIHETGHALYEQGISPRLNRTFLGEGASFGIHESQALLWENIIARGRPWCRWSLPYLSEIFPDVFESVYPEDLYRAINKVESSLIRTESDELTYNMHIMVRYEIEKALINRDISVVEIPFVFNSAMENYLGIKPNNDLDGCLQDIHWADGVFGYFPSYTIGKLYAATFMKALRQTIPDLDDLVSIGDLMPIISWLKENIYQFGKIFTPNELVSKISGNELDSSDFFDLAGEKYMDIYGV